MKKLYPLFVGFAAVTYFHAQTGSVGINTTSPHSSAVLDLTSDTKGFLLPRLTTAAINTLSATAAEGLVVYDKEQKKFLGWDGSKWQNLGYEEQNTAPYATNVTVSGTYQSGQVLTGNYSYTDADGNPESGTTFSWKRADDSSGKNVQIISGAAAQTYTQQSSDIGKFIQFCVTPQSNVGLSPGLQKCSAFGGPTAALPTNAAPTVSSVSVSGNLNVGSVLTGTYTYNDAESDAQNTTASGSSYQWKIADDASGTNLTNAAGPGNAGATNGTNKTYTLQSAEVGKYIKYCVKPVANTGTTAGVETCSAFSGPIINLKSGVIAYESFEGGVLQPDWSITTSNADSASGFVNTNSPASWYPANSPRAADGSYGYQFGGSAGTAGVATLLSPVINTTGYTNNITFSMRVAAFSTSSGQGLDSVTSDYVKVEYSTDGGATYSTSSISLGGNSNSVWPFSTTGTISLNYGSTAVSQSQTNTGTNMVSKIVINNIPNTLTNLKFRITVRDNQTASLDEYWVIDDIKIVAP